MRDNKIKIRYNVQRKIEGDTNGENKFKNIKRKIVENKRYSNICTIIFVDDNAYITKLSGNKSNS